MNGPYVSEEMNQALTELNSAICSLNRSCGRGFHLLLIPNQLDEPIFLSDNGNPLPLDTLISPEVFFEGAMDFRRKDGKF